MKNKKWVRCSITEAFQGIVDGKYEKAYPIDEEENHRKEIMVRLWDDKTLRVDYKSKKLQECHDIVELSDINFVLSDWSAKLA